MHAFVRAGPILAAQALRLSLELFARDSPHTLGNRLAMLDPIGHIVLSPNLMQAESRASWPSCCVSHKSRLASYAIACSTRAVMHEWVQKSIPKIAAILECLQRTLQLTHTRREFI